MRLATATNRCASRSLAGHAAREDRTSPFGRQLPKIYPALPIGDVVPTRDSGRGLTTRFVPQISCGADS